eukprot:15340992-Ditylum_brightwellii.AAC.1
MFSVDTRRVGVNPLTYFGYINQLSRTKKSFTYLHTYLRTGTFVDEDEYGRSVKGEGKKEDTAFAFAERYKILFSSVTAIWWLHLFDSINDTAEVITLVAS